MSSLASVENAFAEVLRELSVFHILASNAGHIKSSKAKIPMGRFLHIDEVASMAFWIAGPECSFTTGFVFDLTGGRATD